jgi:ElaB/YqjD/DUF883 family membrane-anchored ribosome-binding protein
MPDRTPHEHLKDLHAELLAAQGADDATEEELRQLADEVRRVLDRPLTSAEDAYRTLRVRLAGAAAAFQDSHPKLTETIEGVVDTLGTHNL